MLPDASFFPRACQYLPRSWSDTKSSSRERAFRMRVTSATALEATQSGDEAAVGPVTASAAVFAPVVWGGTFGVATTQTGGSGDGAGSSCSMGQSPHM